MDAAGQVVVEDAGPGVPDAQKLIIFERFWRGGQERSGSGIGLALVSRIVRMHQGSARVEDRPGAAGARFILRFAPSPAAVEPLRQAVLPRRRGWGLGKPFPLRPLRH